MIRSTRVRAMFACFGLALCFTTLSGRLVFLQVCNHADGKHVVRQTSYARRGAILDINQEILADNEPIRTAVADGTLIADAKGTGTAANVACLAEILSKELGLDAGELRKKLATDRRYVVLKREVPEAVAVAVENRIDEENRLREKKHRALLRGITFERDSMRVYPNGKMLCHVIGFMTNEHEGGREAVQGIEKTMDEYLRGHDGFRYTEIARTGKEIVPYRGEERAERNGFNVRLTIDMGLQNIVETEMESAVKQFKPEKAIVVLMRPQTGEILALANSPNFDLNNVGDGKPEAMKNAAILDMVEPGSTFKIVTAAAALNENLVRPESVIFCENGVYNFGGRPLHDHHAYADLSVQEILMKSSNIGAAKLAMKLGELRFYEYIRRFGFGERTGVLLPGEIGGVIHPPDKWTKISITRIPMGQEVAVTPLQMITAMSAIANGGRLMMPQIVHDVLDEQGAVVASFPPQQIRQAVSAEAAKQVRDALKTVVSDKGTAALAKVAGYSVFGKTGTAQKVDPKGGYASGKYIVSFVGGLPADNPEFVCLVMLDDAKTKSDQNYGGLVAAPIFSRIAEKAARYLNLRPEPEETPNITITQSKPERN